MFGKKKQPPVKSLIAHGTSVRGLIEFQEGLRIDGEVTGDILAAPGKSSLLVVSESARVTGQVQADHVVINGEVVGPVMARELLELQPTARIRGDVSYRGLEMHQGATISGKLQPLDNSDAGDEQGEKPLLSLASKAG